MFYYACNLQELETQDCHTPHFMDTPKYSLFVSLIMENHEQLGLDYQNYNIPTFYQDFQNT